ncbi:MAG: SGNH/GDSL hydrolase family protein [Gammaproteobacteria bacterium]|nr:SGNH/GDSL hydrolase family protein [Gammaproteobacteria bacterium]
MKNNITNIILALFSIFLSLFIAEALARIIIEPRSSPIGHGILHQKFQLANVTVNSEGYRDGEFSDKKKNVPNIVFIGDSFTFGHGVLNNKVFPSRVRDNLFPKYETYNLGICGSNSLDQLKTLESKLSFLNGDLNIIVHQYLGNDIDYMAEINIMPSYGIINNFLIWLSDNSYLADYIYQPYLINMVIDENLDKIYRAYDEKMSDHLMDVEKIWNMIHKNKSLILFVIFPIYIDGFSLQKSRELYVNRLIEHFLKTCQEGDGVINVLKLIEQHPMVMNRNYWVANRIDPHPSAELHQLVANEVINYIKSKPGNFMRCKNRLQ